MATNPGTPAAPVDVSFSEALNDYPAGLMLVFDPKREGQGLFTDFLYTGARSDEGLLPASTSLTLRSVTWTTVFSLA